MSSVKPSKKTRKSVPTTHEGTKPTDVPQATTSDSSGDEGGSSTDDDIDEEGMSRLMNALGDDGLDEYEQAQLQILGGDEDEEWDTEDEGDESEDGENGSEGEEGSGHELDGQSDAASSNGTDAEDEIEEDPEEDIALDDVDSVDEDAVPRQKIEIDNKVALERIRDTIQLDPSLPWTETLVLSYPQTIDIDVNDDLNRELAFYKQALHGANTARSLAAKLNFPFTRPTDYFAEMVKSDSHMERIRQRLLDESAGIKKSEDKRKEREGKKFGKQVQLEKLKEREKSKKDMEERLKGLKRKRKDVLDNPQAEEDAFDVAVEDAISDRPASKRGKGARGGRISRDARDKKFGFGGEGKRSKQNTKESTDDFDSGSRGRGRGGFRGGGGRGGRGRGGGRGDGGSRGGGGGRGGSKRPGKSRRINARSKA